ncbi:MAG: sulfotransferase family protein [Bacteroidia bacterium]
MSEPATTSFSPQIAFIVGMGRSGTTMLTNMLNSNPEIIASPENEFIIHSYSSFYQKDFGDPAVVDSFTDIFNHNFNRVISIWKPGPELKNDIARLPVKSFANVCKLAYLNYPLSQKRKENVKWVIDKNPSYSLHIDTLQELFPSAKFIVIVRDHRDNIVSRKKYSDENVPIHKLAADWNYYYERIFKSMKKNKISYHLIRYEDLASDPTRSLRSLCAFIDIPYSEQMLNFQELSKDLKKHAVENISKEKNEKIQRMHSNLEKKVNTERVNAFVNELKPEEIALLDYACSKLAKQFGYAKYDSSASVSVVSKLKYKFSYLKTTLYGILNNFRYKLPRALRPAPSKNRI